MSPRGPLFGACASLLLLLSALGSGPARATNAQPAVGATGPKSIPELVRDLSDEDAPVRLFAARTLRRQVKRALRRADRRPGSETADDALSALQDFDQLLAPACALVVGQGDNITAHCADILGGLETASALPALQAAARAEVRARPKRHLDAAVTAITAGSPAGSPTMSPAAAPPPPSATP